MFLVVLLCIKLSISYKKFSFFMLSREFKGMNHKCYVCRVYVYSACVQVYKHLCM